MNSKNNGKKKKKKFNIVAWYVIVLVILYCAIFVLPKITGILNTTYVAQYGELRTEDKVKGYIIRDEKVFLSQNGGDTKRLVAEGDLVRGGTPIVEISGSNDSELSDDTKSLIKKMGKAAETTSSYTSDGVGLVSYYYDGYEGILNSSNLDKKKSFFEKLDDVKPIKIDNDSVAKGAPVYKLIDRRNWYLVAFVDKNHIDRYKEGNMLSVEFDEDTSKDKVIEPVEMTVVSAKKEGDNARLTLKSDRYFPNQGMLRTAEVSLVTADVKGLILEESSLTKKKGQQGVYIKNKQGKYDFKPVQILARNGKKVVVSDSYFHDEEGTKVESLNPYDDVLKKPEK